MKFIAHAFAESRIDHFVPLDPVFAVECRGNDVRGIVITVTCQIGDSHLGIGQGGEGSGCEAGCAMSAPRDFEQRGLW